MNCLKCGTQNLDEARFCTGCGNDLSINNSVNNLNNNIQNPNITNNNQDINTNINNINSVNNAQVGMNYNNYNSPNPTPMKPKNKLKINKKIVIILLAVILVIVLVFLGYKLLFKKDSSTSSTYNVYDINNPIVVEKDGLYGYIDSNGKFIIEPKYTNANSFKGKFALVEAQVEKDGDIETQYQMIDRKGNVKLVVNDSSSLFDKVYDIDDYDINYEEEYDIWIIRGKLYDGDLNLLSKESEEVEYEENGYLIFEDEDNNTAGLMNVKGEKIYTYNFETGEDSITIEFSDNDEWITENYCVVNVEYDKYGIINCDTGKVIYDLNTYRISLEDNNVFEVYDRSTYSLVSLMYIQNDKIVYETSSDNVSIYDYDGYFKIYDYDKDYSERYSYIDVKTGTVVTEQPEIESNDEEELSEFEKQTDYRSFSCNSGYGVMKGDKIVIECKWDKFYYLDEELYKYLKSKGKEYIFAEKDNKFYLYDLKTGEQIEKFNTDYIYTTESTFIEYEDETTGKDMIYNLYSNKSIEEKDSYSIYSNYIKNSSGGKVEYYNTNFELIYTE